MTLIYYVIFYNVIYFSGRSIHILYNRIFRKEENFNILICGYDISTFYPILTLFFIGNFSNILNFILPIKNLIYVLPFLLLFNIFEKNNRLLTKDFLLTNLIFPLIISISSIGTGFHYDAGLYHLNHQYFLKESNIIIGLTTIDFAYGWSSIYEYISAFFQVGSNFIILHFINITFMVQFFTFMYKSIFRQENNFLRYTSLFILIFGILDNFGLDGGRNGFIDIQGVGKFDNAFGIVFTIFNLLIISRLMIIDYSKIDLLFISLLSLFSFQLKITGGLSLVLYLIYLFFYIKNQNIGFSIIFRLISPFSLLLIFWMIKNVLSSGCLVFGIEISCFESLHWYDNGFSTYSKIETSVFNLAYTFDQNIFEWFKFWSNNRINFVFIVNFIISIIILFTISFMFFIKRKKISNSLYAIIWIYIFLNIFVWITGAPDPRFGSGLFILIIFLITLKISDYRNIFDKLKHKSIIYTFIILICIISIPRLSSYENLSTNFNSLVQLTIPEVEYSQNNAWGVNPLTGDQCWVNSTCRRITNPVKIRKFLIFEIYSTG
jgi:hypothetical protein